MIQWGVTGVTVDMDVGFGLGALYYIANYRNEMFFVREAKEGIIWLKRASGRGSWISECKLLQTQNFELYKIQNTFYINFVRPLIRNQYQTPFYYDYFFLKIDPTGDG